MRSDILRRAPPTRASTLVRMLVVWSGLINDGFTSENVLPPGSSNAVLSSSRWKGFISGQWQLRYSLTCLSASISPLLPQPFNPSADIPEQQNLADRPAAHEDEKQKYSGMWNSEQNINQVLTWCCRCSSVCWIILSPFSTNCCHDLSPAVSAAFNTPPRLVRKGFPQPLFALRVRDSLHQQEIFFPQVSNVFVRPSPRCIPAYRYRLPSFVISLGCRC